MKIKTIIFHLILFAVLFVLPIWGQTPSKITFSPAPANLDDCTIRPGASGTFVDVLIPGNLNPPILKGVGFYIRETNFHVYRFEGNSLTCRKLADGYEISASGSGQTSPVDMVK